MLHASPLKSQLNRTGFVIGYSGTSATCTYLISLISSGDMYTHEPSSDAIPISR
ncbi:TPA: hypothetical protein SMN72_003484 [Proteus mirabilis]|nr:hypothetical protein [Proteus mirabilis]HBC6377512.1 hypothetical protein [Proteus mirabilis]HCT2706943.1 hypothetical protein [Proteus mirabilis]HCU0227178.1 hypothetical protein [Proteus mirabilis]HEJ0133000.1 hypothetical protein [Proteus mirabilis]